MSRRAATAAMLAFAVALPCAAGAQDSATAEQALETAEGAYGPPAPPAGKACPPIKDGEEIVVCAEQQEQSQFEYSGNEEAENRYARETMDKGAPRAPDLFGIPNHGMVSVRGCFLQACPPPPAHVVDFSALPEAPPGSDADRVGRGLAPRGDESMSGPGAAVNPPGSASPAAPLSGLPSLRVEPAPR